ncbi:hypothetical protein WJX81_006602 [Elliptochloris bilobata]|uniref:Mannosyl-oligosaccharide glucosidase n=1 Tax=Elliptochloris bilobata TaxID=381761 RepID=A0AAW1RWQ6_9CHLO
MDVRQRPPALKKTLSIQLARRRENTATHDHANAQRPADRITTPLGLLMLLGVACVAWFAYPTGLPPEVSPLRAPRLSLLPQFQGEHREGTLWGTYRPGLYFGMRMRVPQSLLVGLMWFDPDRPDPLAHLRHLAQERDGLEAYGWAAHDGEAFGRQELTDGGLRLTTSLAKRFCHGCTGGDWALRLAARAAGPGPSKGEWSGEGEGEALHEQQRVSIILYVADEDAGNAPLEVLPDNGETNAKRLLVRGHSAQLGHWTLQMQSRKGGGALRLRYLGARTRHFHNLTELAADALRPGEVAAASAARRGARRRYTLPDTAADGANLAMLQITAKLPLHIDFVFTGSLSEARQQGLLARLRRWARMPAGDCLPGAAEPPAESVAERFAALSGDRLSSMLAERERAFDERFQRTFGSFAPGAPQGTEAVAKAALSNLLGGIGYFYGRSEVALPGGRRAWSPPAGLLTAVPSRPFFPRGFMWDEGFHQLLVRRWNPRLSRDILASWLDLLNSQGWIAREQILGEEARARVPAEFVAQHPDVANPPTLFLPLAAAAARLRALAPAGLEEEAARVEAQDRAEDLAFLRTAYPRLRAWLRWLTATQAGPLPGSFCWRGRVPQPPLGRELNPKTLSSGLDDYPRASHPGPEERHLDLMCWVALAARALASIGASLQLPLAEVAPLEALAAQLADARHLQALHWDAGARSFADWGNHTEGVRLEWVAWRTPQGAIVRHELVRVEDGPLPAPGFVPHFGYVSLFPLLMRLLSADSLALGELLAGLGDPARLWTPHGLRSLSADSSLYRKRNTEHDAPYWRGPVWLNINYLALAALQHYAGVSGPHRAEAARLHSELRRNLLQTVVGEAQRSGYLWENYDEATGRGRGSHPFTGWTALVVLIAGEAHLDM